MTGKGSWPGPLIINTDEAAQNLIDAANEAGVTEIPDLKVCPYGEWLWRRVNRGGQYSRRRDAHYWLHVLWCPWCNYLIRQYDRELVGADD